LPIRPATEADLPTLIEMQRDFYALEGIEFDAGAAQRSMGMLISDPMLGRLLVIEEDTVVGFAAIMFGFSLEFRGRSALLDELYVAPHARGRGLGSAMLRFVEDLCADASATVLQLEVRRDNDRANALYQRVGFFDRENMLLSKHLTRTT